MIPIVCTPDDQKLNIIKYCLEKKKNVLVEKPCFQKKTTNYINLKNWQKK